mmetsp:Transcript_2877/g.7552  ORF Transcript_2877/g.7552 Transcript_2877/m.7552 type:complete len:228 (-) Transcript_2877:1140-1823(-)
MSSSSCGRISLTRRSRRCRGCTRSSGCRGGRGRCGACGRRRRRSWRGTSTRTRSTASTCSPSSSTLSTPPRPCGARACALRGLWTSRCCQKTPSFNIRGGGTSKAGLSCSRDEGKALEEKRRERERGRQITNLFNQRLQCVLTPWKGLARWHKCAACCFWSPQRIDPRPCPSQEMRGRPVQCPGPPAPSRPGLRPAGAPAPSGPSSSPESAPTHRPTFRAPPRRTMR